MRNIGHPMILVKWEIWNNSWIFLFWSVSNLLFLLIMYLEKTIFFLISLSLVNILNLSYLVYNSFCSIYSPFFYRYIFIPVVFFFYNQVFYKLLGGKHHIMHFACMSPWFVLEYVMWMIYIFIGWFGISKSNFILTFRAEAYSI